MSTVPHRTFPCTECPWRKDSPPQFTEEQFEHMAPSCADRDRGYQPAIGDTWFACHKGQPGDESTDVACAGWLATEAHSHMGVRFAVIEGRLPAQTLEPDQGWPELYSSFTQMRESPVRSERT
ncbi:DUF6283 family protein [Nocardiopsis synnemataformans]|uniref:DUF6283 family protein n=1 Tax=Nocardiopsis synnemataformans TaxID=61305 RepID=UPI003EB8ADD7